MCGATGTVATTAQPISGSQPPARGSSCSLSASGGRAFSCCWARWPLKPAAEPGNLEANPPCYPIPDIITPEKRLHFLGGKKLQMSNLSIRTNNAPGSAQRGRTLQPSPPSRLSGSRRSTMDSISRFMSGCSTEEPHHPAPHGPQGAIGHAHCPAPTPTPKSASFQPRSGPRLVIK